METARLPAPNRWVATSDKQKILGSWAKQKTGFDIKMVLEDRNHKPIRWEAWIFRKADHFTARHCGGEERHFHLVSFGFGKARHQSENRP